MSESWRPSKRQLELLADCACAGLDASRTAALLGVSALTFLAWTKRLSMASAEEERREAEEIARPATLPTRAEQERWRRAVLPAALQALLMPRPS
jgi:hypothetical protein